MATKRDVELALRVKTEGAETLGDLAGDLREVADEGSQLGSVLSRNAAGLAQLTAATRQFRADEAAASAEVAKVKRSIDEQRDALARLKINYAATGGDAAKYKTDVQKLSLALVESRAELRKKEDALKSASDSAKAAAIAERNLAAEIERSAKTAVKATAETRAGLESVNRVGMDAAGTLRTLGPLLAGAFSTANFVKTIAEAESLDRSFQQIFGSAGKAAEEMDFIRATANRLGLENLALAKSYQSLSASTKGTTLEGQSTRDVFEAVARAMSTLGKSTADTDRALVAISQIASKGAASMEELRGQLGEALPGAMKAAADGAGLTVEQLVEMVSSGKVLAGDIIPALTKGLNDLYGKAAPPQNITSEWARLKNVLSETAIAIGEGGASKGLTKTLSVAALAAQGFTAVFDVMGTAVGESAAAIATGNYEVSEGEAQVEKYANALRKTAETAGLVEKAQSGLNSTQGESAKTAAEASRALEGAAEKQAQAGESLLKTKAMYAEAASGAAAYTTQIEKEVIARRDESSALAALVNLQGSEIEKRQVAVIVTEAQADAAQRLGQAREVEAVIAQSLALRLQGEALKRGDNTEATRKEIEAAQKSAAAKNTEAEGAKAAAASKRIEAESARVNASAYQDNAAKVGEFRAAAAEAVREVERLTALQKNGKATDDQVAHARTKAAGATRLYRDALSDATAAAQRHVTIEQQMGQSALATISVEIERAKAAREVALANGDAMRAAALQRQEADLQIQAAGAAADAFRREAQAIRDAAAAKEAELRATGDLTAAKRDEIDAQRRAADLKDIEAEKSDILAGKVRALAASEQARTTVLEQQIAAQERSLALAERAAEVERKRRGVDKEGFATNTAGERVVAAGIQLGGDEQSRRAATIRLQLDQIRKGAQYSQNLTNLPETDALLRELAALEASISRERSRRAAPVPQAMPVPAPSAPTQSMRTVNISIGGRSTPVTVASQADSDALVALLRQLENSKGTSA